MNITLEGGEDEKATVSVDGKPCGVIKVRSGHFLCYSNGRHTTTQSLEEVIRFFNGDYGSYYWRQREWVFDNNKIICYYLIRRKIWIAVQIIKQLRYTKGLPLTGTGTL